MFALVYLLAYTFKVFSPNRNDEKLHKCESLLDAIPLYPGSELVFRSGASKDKIASVGRTYKSKDGYEKLKWYYIQTLKERGWQVIGERDVSEWDRSLGGRVLSFRQDQCELNIQYAGEKTDFGWDYSLDIHWQS